MINISHTIANIVGNVSLTAFVMLGSDMLKSNQKIIF